MLAAVQQKGYALQYAAEPLKADREVVLAAVQQDGSRALQILRRESACEARPSRSCWLAVLKNVKRRWHSARIAAADTRLQVCTLSGARRTTSSASAVCAGRPTRLTAFLTYARELREANVKAKVDLWLTCHNDGELHHWMDATHTGFKRRKREHPDKQ